MIERHILKCSLALHGVLPYSRASGTGVVHQVSACMDLMIWAARWDVMENLKAQTLEAAPRLDNQTHSTVVVSREWTEEKEGRIKRRNTVSEEVKRSESDGEAVSQEK